MIPTRFLVAAALVTFARAQLTTLSTIPVINGETVVVSLSTDAVGATVPVVIGTLSSAAATSPVATPGVTTTPVATTSTPVAASTSAPATSTAVAVTNTVTTTTPRVVGQPGSTNPAPGPTTYTYTTRDANGQTTIVVDVFTASYGYATSTASPKPPGTILPYDVYTSLYGGGAGNNNQLNAARELAVSGAGALMCVIGGMAMLL